MEDKERLPPQDLSFDALVAARRDEIDLILSKLAVQHHDSLIDPTMDTGTYKDWAPLTTKEFGETFLDLDFENDALARGNTVRAAKFAVQIMSYIGIEKPDLDIQGYLDQLKLYKDPWGVMERAVRSYLDDRQHLDDLVFESEPGIDLIGYTEYFWPVQKVCALVWMLSEMAIEEQRTHDIFRDISPEDFGEDTENGS